MNEPPSGPLTSGVPDHVVPAENADDLYEHAPCGYLSSLPDGTIIKVNQTLLSWIGHRREDLIGKKRFVDLLSAGGRIYHETHYAPLLAMQGHVREIALEFVCADGRRLPVLINSILVRTEGGDPHVIRTSVFDATDRRGYERELLQARERAEGSEARARLLAQTLQQSLMPPSLPTIPGVQLAAAYRPAGAGDEVGGDFYDVFEAGKGDWAVVLGDVCGKGSEAAVVTALARYTARAMAMRTRRPRAILSGVNSGLLRHPTDRFCTMLYVRTRPNPGGRPKITVCSAGHAVPMLLSRQGVDPTGKPGTLLGVLDDLVLHDVTIELGPGDALFCYTDGLTEGRRDEEFFGERRLREILHDARDGPADDIVRRVMQEALDFQHGQPRDDIAIVVLRAPDGHHPER